MCTKLNALPLEWIIRWPWVHILKPVTSFIRWLPQWFKGVYYIFFYFSVFQVRSYESRNFDGEFICTLQLACKRYPPFDKNMCLKHSEVMFQSLMISMHWYFLFTFFCNWGHLSKTSWKSTTKRFLFFVFCCALIAIVT